MVWLGAMSERLQGLGPLASSCLQNQGGAADDVGGSTVMLCL